MHHSGALLLEARDGEFLDEQLCCSNIAASMHLQQPDQQVRPVPEGASHDAMDTGNDEGYDGAEGCSHDFDDCGGGDDGSDYMQQETADLDNAGMPGQRALWQHSMPFQQPPPKGALECNIMTKHASLQFPSWTNHWSNGHDMSYCACNIHAWVHCWYWRQHVAMLGCISLSSCCPQ